MRINHGGFDVARPHPLLDASNAASAWQSRKLGMHIIMLAMASLLDGQHSRLINGDLLNFYGSNMGVHGTRLAISNRILVPHLCQFMPLLATTYVIHFESESQ
jgi:hypothetical protein